MPKTKNKQPTTDFFVAFVKTMLQVDFQKEYKFLSDRRFKFDYANLHYKIAIEKEGGIFRKGGGAHSRPANIMRDIEKYTLAGVSGWIIIRRTPKQLNTSETLRLIREAMATRFLQNK